MSLVSQPVTTPSPSVAEKLQKAMAKDETVGGVAPTRTVGESYPRQVSRVADYATLFKLRVTSMVVLTAWAGFYMGSRRYGIGPLSWRLLETLIGVGLVSAGASGMNQVLERDADSKMSRTKDRPLPGRRISPLHASVVATMVAALGIAMLSLTSNLLTGGLALATAASYVFIYTPLKKVAPFSTFVGAFPGAMPAVLGWTAATGRLEWRAFALFAVLFFWQFPHFLAIAWLYREDYERAGIRMLPVVDLTGRATLRQILFCGSALIPISLVPFFLNLSNQFFIAAAILLGAGYLWFGIRLARLHLPPTAAESKKHARQLLQASVVYLPLLLLLLMLNRTVR